LAKLIEWPGVLNHKSHKRATKVNKTMQSPDQPTQWSEQNSQIFIDYGSFYVPAREKHARIVTQLLKSVPGLGQVVDLCCGEGLLSKHILNTIPTCRLAAYDLSEAMLAKTRVHLKPFNDRVTTRQFDLRALDWRSMTAIGAFVSSLAVHHLNGPEKQQLYLDLHRMLQPGGVFVLIDIVLPTRKVGVKVAAQEWDICVKQNIEAASADPAIFKTFKEEGWNFYDDPTADPIDQPSGLLEQLTWLNEVGFIDVDVLWMDAGHVIVAGWKEI
jgi:tRNA (cmo5U34)-methyltransferase